MKKKKNLGLQYIHFQEQNKDQLVLPFYSKLNETLGWLWAHATVESALMPRSHFLPPTMKSITSSWPIMDQPD